MRHRGRGPQAGAGPVHRGAGPGARAHHLPCALGRGLRPHRAADPDPPRHPGVRAHAPAGGTGGAPAHRPAGRGQGAGPPRQPVAQDPARSRAEAQGRGGAGGSGYRVAGAGHRHRPRGAGLPHRRAALHRHAAAAGGALGTLAGRRSQGHPVSADPGRPAPVRGLGVRGTPGRPRPYRAGAPTAGRARPTNGGHGGEPHAGPQARRDPAASARVEAAAGHCRGRPLGAGAGGLPLP